MKLTYFSNTSSEPGLDRDSKDRIVRPVRFPIRTLFRYRESGAGFWRKGFTIDISRSGVLFEAETVLAPKTVLEMQIAFSSELTGGTPASIACCGPVVRCETGEARSRPMIMAAYFFNYRFAPQ